MVSGDDQINATVAFPRMDGESSVECVPQTISLHLDWYLLAFQMEIAYCRFVVHHCGFRPGKPIG